MEWNGKKMETLKAMKMENVGSERDVATIKQLNVESAVQLYANCLLLLMGNVR